MGESRPKEVSIEHIITAEICTMCLNMLHHLLVRGGYIHKCGKEEVVVEVLKKMLEIWKNLAAFGNPLLVVVTL